MVMMSGHQPEEGGHDDFSDQEGVASRNPEGIPGTERRPVEPAQDAQGAGRAESRDHAAGMERCGYGDERDDDYLLDTDEPETPYRQSATGQQITFEHARIAPLPEPFEMAGYGQIDKSFPERIMRMAEKNMEARHEDQRSRAASRDRLVRAESAATKVFAFTSAALVVGGVGGGIWITLAGNPGTGIWGIIAGGLVGLSKLASAIKGRSSDDE